MIRVATVLDHWKPAREDTALAVEEFPRDRFGYRPVPELQTFEEIARHIPDAGHGITGILPPRWENPRVPNLREMITRFGGREVRRLGTIGFIKERELKHWSRS